MKKNKALSRSVYDDPNQLWLELVVPLLEATRAGNKTRERERPGNTFTWTEEEIDILIEGFLQDSLHTLLDRRTGLKSRQEVFDWLMEPFANIYRGEKPRPMSFQFCCQWLGLDHAEVQERTLEVMRQEGFLTGLVGPKVAEINRLPLIKAA